MLNGREGHAFALKVVDKHSQWNFSALGMLAPEPFSCRRSVAAQELDDQEHQCYDE